MKLQYFKETDTLYIRLNDHEPVETREINENLLVDIDGNGRAVGLTIEHAMEQTGKLDFSLETTAA
jgi:uncharacterized protein YuzE